jgi:hybrid cluster-associated redox disulfide protein
MVENKPQNKNENEGGPVSADMNMGEIIEKYPETIPVLLKYGLHCIGCHVASWESLRDGLMAHGMDEKGIKEVVDEINRTIREFNKALEDRGGD